MNRQKGFVNIVLIILIVVLAGTVGYFTLFQKPNPIIQLPHEDLSKFGSEGLACISGFSNNIGKEFVVNTEAEYQDLVNYKSYQCTNFVLPPIDFSQKTLLGKSTSGGGCSIDFAKNVYKDDSNRKIIYVIDIIEEGGCDKLGFSSNWISIPKIPFDYTVEFQVK